MHKPCPIYLGIYGEVKLLKNMNYIKENLEVYRNHFSNPAKVLEHLFCTVGNGIRMNLQGYIETPETEFFINEEPVPLVNIYRFSEQYSPILSYKGCRNPGFKEAVKYFMECIMCTPDDVKNIVEWKENIDLFQKILDAPEITPRYAITDMDKFLEDIAGDKCTIDNIQDGTVVQAANSVQKVWFFDVQWSDCPKRVAAEVQEMWGVYELRNDDCIVKTILDENLFEEYPNVYFWLLHKGVSLGEKVIIHWWW